MIIAVSGSFPPPSLGSIVTGSHRVDSFDPAPVAKRSRISEFPRLSEPAALLPDGTVAPRSLIHPGLCENCRRCELGRLCDGED